MKLRLIHGMIAGMLVATALAGCNVLPEPAPLPARHDFGPPTTSAKESPSLPVTLSTVTAPSWLDSSAILYRRGAASTRLQSYGRNQWAAPPAELLRNGLEARLAAGSGPTPDPRYALELRLLRFEQVLDGNDSRVVLSIEVVLRDRDSRRLVARRLFQDEQPVAADIGGAVQGLAGAANGALDAIVRWTKQNLPQDSSAGGTP